MKRKLVWAGAGLLLLLFLLAGGLWIFRNRILNRVAKEKIAWVEQRYGLEVHYDYLKFEGNGQLSPFHRVRRAQAACSSPSR